MIKIEVKEIKEENNKEKENEKGGTKSRCRSDKKK